MPILGVFSAKGGVGSSILATNMGCVLTNFGSAALVDVHPGGGADDMLVDLTPRHTWDELLLVASELTDRHFDLIRTKHSSGLAFYAAPNRWDLEIPSRAMTQIIKGLGERVDWVILDLPVGLNPFVEICLSVTDRMLLVTTADPVALRATKQLIDQNLERYASRVGLVLNQFTRRHPAKPRQIADGIGINLLATLPSDVRAVGYQVNFGRVAVADSRSGYGRAVTAFAKRLSQGQNHIQSILSPGNHT